MIKGGMNILTSGREKGYVLCLRIFIYLDKMI